MGDEIRAELFFACLSLLPTSAEFPCFKYTIIVLNIPLGRITGEYRDSVSVLLVSALIPLTPADNSYARATLNKQSCVITPTLVYRD